MLDIEGAFCYGLCMSIRVMIPLLVGISLLSSCGGGGGGNDPDPLDQPMSFVPEGVNEATLEFSDASAFISPVKLALTQEGVEKTTELKADVVEGDDNVRLEYTTGGQPPSITTMTAKLTGNVRISRKSGNQGYLLIWGETTSYNDTSKAVLNGTMLLQFLRIDDARGERQAVVVNASDVKILHYYNNEQKEYPVRLEGTSVLIRFPRVNGDADTQDE